MKKFTAIVLLSALLLTACTNSETPESSDTQSSSTNSTDFENSSTPNSSSTMSSSSLTTSSSSNSDSSTGYEDPEIVESFSAPDGSILYMSDAVDSEDGIYFKFDHSYIRYAKPIFHNTLDEPDLVNWDTLDFKVDINMPIEDPGTFKVKAGDKLKNGLTVKSAEFWALNGYINQNRIELSGELTLEGILYRAPEDGYNVSTDDLTFFADSTKCDSIPITTNDMSNATLVLADTENEFAMVGDETRIKLGNYNDISVDLSGIINRGEYVKTKITIKDIYLTIYTGPGRSTSATLVSVDKIR